MGSHLDQAISPCLPRHVGCLFLRRTLLLRICIRASELQTSFRFDVANVFIQNDRAISPPPSQRSSPHLPHLVSSPCRLGSPLNDGRLGGIVEGSGLAISLWMPVIDSSHFQAWAYSAPVCGKLGKVTRRRNTRSGAVVALRSA